MTFDCEQKIRNLVKIDVTIFVRARKNCMKKRRKKKKLKHGGDASFP